MDKLKHPLQNLVNGFFLSVVTLGPVSAQTNVSQNFSLNGRIKGFGNGYFVCKYIPDSTTKSGYRADTIFVKNDIIAYKTRIEQPVVLTFHSPDQRLKKTAMISLNGKMVEHDFANESGLTFIAKPKSAVKIEGEIKEYLTVALSGNNENEELSKLQSVVDPLLNQFANLNRLFFTAKDKAPTLKKQLDSVYHLADNRKLQFIKTHPKNTYASMLIWEKITYLKDPIGSKADSLAKLLNPATFYKSDFEKIKTAFLISQKEIAIGKPAPNFEKHTTFDGKQINLSDLRGKYVLVDFWGTWCVPCVREMPSLKQFYEKNKGRFYMLGISKSEQAEWLSFLKQNNYDWIQINLKSEELVKKFNVDAFPTKFILDPEGKFVAINPHNALEQLQKLIDKQPKP